MLQSLKLHHVGPAADLSMDPLAPRFNLITGDNGLGKSFLLDLAWWGLTRTWAEMPAFPNAPGAKVNLAFRGSSRTTRETARWVPREFTWRRGEGGPANPGLVLYARVDGSFAVWDPARNDRRYPRLDGSEEESPSAYVFAPKNVLWGLKRRVLEGARERDQVLCKGLIVDWVLWQSSHDPRFALLKSLLAQLGPDASEPLAPGEPKFLWPSDDSQIPTIRMPYGQDVPIVYAPAGVQRMSRLAYLLAWAFSSHVRAAEQLETPVTDQVTLLVDEPETHLHPRWQRTVLPALYGAIASWRPDLQVQVLVATHSPMVLASMEPVFDDERDALWVLDLVDNQVVLQQDTWQPRGDVSRWLRSDVFDLKEATSQPAEVALIRAKAAMSEGTTDTEELDKIEVALKEALPEMDPFLHRWRHFRDHPPLAAARR